MARMWARPPDMNVRRISGDRPEESPVRVVLRNSLDSGDRRLRYIICVMCRRIFRKQAPIPLGADTSDMFSSVTNPFRYILSESSLES